ncbi:MAG: protein TolQ [Deltaproteobacteria bacterium]|nr:protein TolQ [Deltaproteobacteria bacterium]
MIVNAGAMVKFVLAILLLFSIISWAIIFYKYLFFKRLDRESRAFLKLFWDKKQFGLLAEACKNYKLTPFARLFMAGYNEVANLKREEGLYPSAIEMGGLDSIQRALKKALAIEVGKMEKAIPFLATTGNTTPFIGLFGTVWGIMNSFRAIGVKGAANLGVVAPGISEALIATALGLAAAIPAVVAYNHYVTKINRLISDIENFIADFLNIVERHLLKEQKGR